VAFEAGVIDWLPLARIPSWPGAARSNRTRPKIRLQSDPVVMSRLDQTTPRVSTQCLSRALSATPSNGDAFIA